ERHARPWRNYEAHAGLDGGGRSIRAARDVRKCDAARESEHHVCGDAIRRPLCVYLARGWRRAVLVGSADRGILQTAIAVAWRRAQQLGARFHTPSRTRSLIGG